MADIEFYEDDSEDPIDAGDDLSSGYEEYPPDPDAGLTLLQRLEKYCQDENMYTRQMVTRSLLESIRTIETEEEAERLLKCLEQLAEDPEALVRSELMEQVPHIAMFCQENESLFHSPIPTYILPIVVRYLTDNNNQVRKTSQAALLVLLEQDMIQRNNVEEQVCPVILELGHPESIDDFRTEAVALMSKLAPLVGKTTTEKIFLNRFSEMCTDALFHVRKVCATNFGDFCQVVGQENTENVLLTKFYYLCEDGVWGVRKACAECFMLVSCVCSLDIRRSHLSQLFVNLICDQSRWVRMAAFQALGGFISTFADPAVTGLYFNDDGILTISSVEDFQKKCGVNCESVVPISDSTKNSKEESSATSNDEDSSHNPAIDCDSIKPCDSVSPTSSGMSQEPDSDNANSCQSSDAQKLDSTSVPCSEKIETIGVIAMNLDTDDDVTCIEDTKSFEEKRAESSRYKTISEDTSNSSEKSEKCESSKENLSMEVTSSGAIIEMQRNDARKLDNESVVHSSIVDNNSAVQDHVVSNIKDSENNVSFTKGMETTSQNRKSTIPLKDGMRPETGTTEYNSFMYWRAPLPEVELDGDQEDVFYSAEDPEIKSTEKDASSKVGSNRNGTPRTPSNQPTKTQAMDEETDVGMLTASLSEELHGEETVANIGSTHVLGHQVDETTMAIVDGVVQDVNSSNLSFCTLEESLSAPANTSEEQDNSTDEITQYNQDVIPQPLLDHYLSMTDPSRAQTVDSEIAKHCAYSLPAVAYTLGRKHWPCIKELYETLAQDMQWKVRRTLAFSIHELAVILGEEVTCKDLMPVFNGFLKDLDEVRIGILKHFADFLKLLKPSFRQDYLNKLPDFLNTDNNRNWRFREELACQLKQLLSLYNGSDTFTYLAPITFQLLEDHVATVRYSAFGVLSGIVAELGSDQCLQDEVVADVIQRYIHSSRWTHRQMYVQICNCILEEQTIPQSQFARLFLPDLLRLAKDPIPNVRIGLARALSRHVSNSDYFTSMQNSQHSELLEALQILRTDPDRDVKHFFNHPFSDEETDLEDTIPV